MSEKDWITLATPIIASSVVSLIGFVITFMKLKREFRYTIRTHLYQDIKKLYRDLYVSLEKIILDPMLAFEDKYINELLEYKPDIYLFASKEVVQNYRAFGNYLYSIKNNFMQYRSKINPESYEYDKNGEIINQNYNDNDIEDFLYDLNCYKEQNCPSKEELRKKVEVLLDKLKRDLNLIP